MSSTCFSQVRHAALDGGQVFLVHGAHRHAPVVLERPRRRHQHDAIGPESGVAALDIEELLGAEVESEPRLGDADLAELERQLRRDDGVAPVGDVGERPAVDHRRRALERLDQVGMDGVTQERRHRAGDLEILGEHRPAVEGEPEEDPSQSGLEVHQVLGQAEERHHLGRGRDEEPLLAGVALEPSAEAEHDLPEGAIVHVHGAAEEDLPRVDPERVVVIEMVVQAGREQIVSGLHRVDVAGEVEVDRVRRQDLGAAAPRPAALDTEARPDRRLTERDDRPAADPPEGLPEPDRDRRLPVARRGGGDGRDDHELPRRRVTPGSERLDRDLRDLAAIRDELLVGEADAGGDLRNRARATVGQTDTGTSSETCGGCRSGRRTTPASAR